MKTLLLFFALLATLAASAQPPTWNWVQSVPGSNAVLDVAAGPAGDLYVTGKFVGTLQLGGTTLSSPGQCLYVARLNPAGRLIRATKLAATDHVLPTSLVVDEAGSCYVTGSFRGTLSYPGGQLTSQSEYSDDVLTLKIGAGGGVQWAQQASATNQTSASGATTGWAIAVDAAGNSYVTGSVGGGTVRFGRFAFHDRQRKAFLVSYSPQGAVRWANVWQGAGTEASNVGRATAVDGAGNCYVSGNFYGSVAVDGVTLPQTSFDNNLFLGRFDTRTGQLRWLKAPDGYGDGRCLATDATGRVYFADSFSAPATYGATTLTSAGSSDIFVVRYDRQGKAEWATAMGGAAYDFPTDMAVDQRTGRAYLTGSQSITAASQSFIAQLQANGTLLHTELVSGPGTSTGAALALDGRNTVYTCGTSTGRCQFGPYATTSTLTTDYLARFTSSPGLRRQQPLAAFETSVFPNPARGQFTLRVQAPEATAAIKATLYSPHGQIVAQQQVPSTTGSADTSFDTTALPGGLYVLSLEHEQRVTTQLIRVE